MSLGQIKTTKEILLTEQGLESYKILDFVTDIQLIVDNLIHKNDSDNMKILISKLILLKDRYKNDLIKTSKLELGLLQNEMNKGIRFLEA